MKEIKTKNTIYFGKILGRTMADCSDTYYFLKDNPKLSGVQLAKEFLRKTRGAEGKIDRKLKQEEKIEDITLGKMEWGELDKIEETKVGIIKTWWKNFKR